jgi:hypothetical protein
MLLKTFPCLLIPALMLSACAAGNYGPETAVDDPPGSNTAAQIVAECQEQALAPEFDLIRSKVNLSVTGAVPAPFMLASAELPTPAERIEIARWSAIRDDCFQRLMTLMNVPPPGVPQPLWQQVAEIFLQDGQNQHVLMMALASGEMPYGPFVQESTRTSVRMTAALQPFMQEAGAMEQVAMAQAVDQNAAAFGAFVSDLLGATIEILGDASDAGAFRGAYHHHRGGGHGGSHAAYARNRK